MESDRTVIKKSGTSILFLDSRCRVLLLLRDDIPSIPYPNTWDLPGGHVEPHETPRQCITREMMEEMDLDIEPFRFFRVMEFADRDEYVFWKKADFDIDRIRLNEGQRLGWFSWEEACALPLAFGFNAVVDLFFKSRMWET
ncbi:MAG: NUDIX hydrolase [Pseudomonadota bacterium]